jgi:hypothetical protein
MMTIKSINVDSYAVALFYGNSCKISLRLQQKSIVNNSRVF